MSPPDKALSPRMTRRNSARVTLFLISAREPEAAPWAAAIIRNRRRAEQDVEEQFFRVAEELGWDLEQQIAALDEFVRRFGAAGQLDDYLARRGLDDRHPRLRAATRDALLGFLATLGGAQGHLGRYLQQRLREARQAEAAAQAPIPVAPPRASLWSRLLGRRPRAA